MNIENLPETPKANETPSSRPPEPRARKQPRQKPDIPGVDQILYQLLALNSAVLIGSMTTKQGELIHKNLRAVLQVQMKKATSAGTGPVSQDGLAEVCRRDPQILNAIEPFLTQEQTQWLMQEIAAGGDDSV